MTPGKDNAAVVYFRWRNPRCLRLRQARALGQCSAARRTPVGLVALGQHGVAMRANMLHGPSVPKLTPLT